MNITPSVLDKYRNWEGTAEQLAIIAKRVMQKLGVPDLVKDDVAPNERLIRNYVQLGVLDRPERRGKEAIFGFRQLKQYLTARWLIRSGWSLEKIAETFKLEGGDVEILPMTVETPPRVSADDADPNYMNATARRLLESTRSRYALQSNLKALGSRTLHPKRQRLVRIELLPWCYFYVDAEELSRQPLSALEQLGNTLVNALKEERAGRLANQNEED